MPQFSGHWYSGRAARLVFVEAALVGVALWINGQNARGWRELAALVAAAACVAAAIFGLLGGTLPRGALIDTLGVASVGVLLARAALVARLDEQGHNRVLVIGAGQRAAEIERIIRTEAYGEYEIAGKLDPSVDLSEPQQMVAGGGEVVTAAGPLLEQDGPEVNEVALAPANEVVPASQLIVGPGGAPQQIQGPIAEAKVAALRRGEEKPLATVVPLPTHPSPVIAVTARTLSDLVRDLKVDTVVIASEERRSRLPIEEFIRLRLCGVTVLPAQRFAERVLRRVPIALLRPSDLAIGDGLDSPVTSAVKRVFDLVMSAILVVCTAPLLAVLASLIKLDSEGPVWAAQKDPRVTRIGAFLRKTRLDEIPQVFAVFRGDMSFVGPRPERPFFVQQLKSQIPFYGMREAQKPGITGWAQIRYPYGSSVEDARAKLEYDLYYVQHQSLFLDLAICFHTVKTVLFGRGAR